MRSSETRLNRQASVARSHANPSHHHEAAQSDALPSASSPLKICPCNGCSTPTDVIQERRDSGFAEMVDSPRCATYFMFRMRLQDQ